MPGTAYPERLLVPGERVLVHRRPHWRMLAVPVVVPPLAVGTGAFLAARAGALAWRVPLQVAVLVVVLGAVGWFAVAPALRWRFTHFVVTDRRILVREGVWRRVGIEVAGAAVTSVTTRRSVPGRLVGCGTLVVGVEYADEPWEFDGLGAVAATAAVLSRVALERGGLHERDGRDGAEEAGDTGQTRDTADETGDRLPAVIRERR